MTKTLSPYKHFEDLYDCISCLEAKQDYKSWRKFIKSINKPKL